IIYDLENHTQIPPPYIDIFDSPQLMSSPAQVERSMAYN
ncbi:unnamed protein product, partial [Brassica rapa subsp. trilocularis]